MQLLGHRLEFSPRQNGGAPHLHEQPQRFAHGGKQTFDPVGFSRVQSHITVVHFVLYAQQHPSDPISQLEMMFEVERFGRQAPLMFSQFAQPHADISRVLEAFFQQGQVHLGSFGNVPHSQPKSTNQPRGRGQAKDQHHSCQLAGSFTQARAAE
jgi:hypothetical protein